MIEYYQLKYCFSKLRPHFMDAITRWNGHRGVGSLSFDDAFCFLNSTGRNLVVRFPIKDLMSEKAIVIVEFGIYCSKNMRKWETKTIGCDDNDTKVKFLTEKRLGYEQFKGIDEAVNRIENIKIQLDMFFSELNKDNINERLNKWSEPLVQWC